MPLQPKSSLQLQPQRVVDYILFVVNIIEFSFIIDWFAYRKWERLSDFCKLS